jgi:hypothetical protein
MLTHIDFTNPVYWLLIAGGVGAAALFVLGIASVIAFDLKYRTRAEVRAARAALAVSPSAIDRVLFTLAPITMLFLAAYLVLVLALGLPAL